MTNRALCKDQRDFVSSCSLHLTTRRWWNMSKGDNWCGDGQVPLAHLSCPQCLLLKCGSVHGSDAGVLLPENVHREADGSQTCCVPEVEFPTSTPTSAPLSWRAFSDANIDAEAGGEEKVNNLYKTKYPFNYCIFFSFCLFFHSLSFNRFWIFKKSKTVIRIAVKN